MGLVAIVRAILRQFPLAKLNDIRKVRIIISHYIQVNADVYGIYIAGHPSRMSFVNTIFPSDLTQLIFGYLNESSELYVSGPLWREYRNEDEWIMRGKYCNCDVTNSIMASGWDCYYYNIENFRDSQKVIILNCVENIPLSVIISYMV